MASAITINHLSLAGKECGPRAAFLPWCPDVRSPTRCSLDSSLMGHPLWRSSAIRPNERHEREANSLPTWPSWRLSILLGRIRT